MGLILFFICALAGIVFLETFFHDNTSGLFRIVGGAALGWVVGGSTLYILDVSSVGANLGETGTALFILIGGGRLFNFLHKNALLRKKIRGSFREIFEDKTTLIFILVSFAACLWLDFYNLWPKNGDISAAGGAWGDSLFHFSFVRSIERGKNIPVTFPYFANAPMTYHFMFDYFAGKVAELFSPSLLVFNLLSAIGYTFLLISVYEFCRVYFHSKKVGILSSLFLVFQSSLSAFTWLWANHGPGLLTKILHKRGWLSGTEYESWGMFNFNVFISRRHFGLALAVFLFMVLLVKGRAKLRETKQSKIDFPLIILVSLVLGAMPNWNAVVAAVLFPVLGAFGLKNFSKKSFLTSLSIGLVIGAAIAFPQFYFFKMQSATLRDFPILRLGYGAGPSWAAVFKYYFEVTGLKWPLFLLGFWVFSSNILEYLIFWIPFVIANVLQLSPVFYDNNELLFLWLIAMNGFAASMILNSIKFKKPVINYAIILPLVLALMSAGFIDFFALINMDGVLIADKSSKFREWVETTDPKSVFLTATAIPYNDSPLTAITLAGRYLFGVRNCVPACDIGGRKIISSRIYGFGGGMKATLDLAKKNNINYIVVDGTLRNEREIFVDANGLGLLPLRYDNFGIKVYQVP